MPYARLSAKFMDLHPRDGSSMGEAETREGKEHETRPFG